MLPLHEGQVNRKCRDDHIHGGRRVTEDTIAQLSTVIVAPARDAAAGGQRTGVGPTGGDGSHAGEPTYIDRRGAIHRRPVAQLAEVIGAPALDAAAGGQRAGVRPTGGDGGDVLQRKGSRAQSVEGTTAQGNAPDARLPLSHVNDSITDRRLPRRTLLGRCRLLRREGR